VNTGFEITRPLQNFNIKTETTDVKRDIFFCNILHRFEEYVQLRRNTWARKLRELLVTGVKSGGTYREKSCAIHYAGWPFRRTWPTSPWRAHFRSCVRTAFANGDGFCEIHRVALDSLIKKKKCDETISEVFFALEDISILDNFLEVLFIKCVILMLYNWWNNPICLSISKTFPR